MFTTKNSNGKHGIFFIIPFYNFSYYNLMFHVSICMFHHLPKTAFLI